MPSRFTLLAVVLPLLAACDLPAAPAASPDGVVTRGPTPAERSCMSALARQQDAARADVRVVTSTSVPEGDMVVLGIGEGRWRCVANLDGQAQTLLDLAPPPAAPAAG